MELLVSIWWSSQHVSPSAKIFEKEGIVSDHAMRPRRVRPAILQVSEGPTKCQLQALRCLRLRSHKSLMRPASCICRWCIETHRVTTVDVGGCARIRTWWGQQRVKPDWFWNFLSYKLEGRGVARIRGWWGQRFVKLKKMHITYGTLIGK